MKRFLVIMSIFIGLFSLFGCAKDIKSDKEKVIIRFGEKLESDNIKNQKGEQLLDKKSKKIVLYLDKNCGACYEHMETVEIMDKIFSEFDIDVAIIWKDGIDENKLSKYDTAKGLSYTAIDVDVQNNFPTYFILDEYNKVEFITDDFGKFVEKIVGNFKDKKELLIKSSNEYLSKTLFKENSDKSRLIVFSLKGCKDCENAEYLLSDEKIREKYDIEKLYTQDSLGEEKYIDYDNIFLNIYDIDWYPSYLIIDKDKWYKVIRQMNTSEVKSNIE